MAPKLNNNFDVAYVIDEVPGPLENRVIVVPVSFMKENNKVVYCGFPFNEEYEQLMDSFLKKPGSLAPPAWPVYNCIPLGQFGRKIKI